MIAQFCSSMARTVRNATLENPAMSLRDPRTWDSVFGGTMSDTGIRVTHHNALQVAAFFQGASIISGDAALAPLDVYKRLGNDDREVDLKHPAEYLMSDQANEETPAFEFWRRLVFHAVVWGNGYGYIKRRSRVGEPLEMVNMLPDRTKPAYDRKGALHYLTEVDGDLEPLFKEEVFHLKGVSILNSLGIDLVDKAKNILGLALAAEGFASRFFANGAQAGGILEVPIGMKDKAIDNIEEGFRKRTTSKENWFKTAILRDGAKFHQTTIDAQKSQLTEVREGQSREVARILNMPPFKLGLEDSMAYNSTEMAQLVYLTGCLSHWFAAIVGEAKTKLLTETQRRERSHYVEHNVSKLIEIDVKTMNEVLEIQRRNLVINANEWRRKINLNKRADPGGDEYVNPNTKSAGDQTGQTPGTAKPGKTPKAPASDNRVQKHLEALVTDAVNRASRRVCFDARNVSKKPDKFLAWLDGRAHEHRAVVDEMLSAPLGTVAALLETDGEAIQCAASGKLFTLLLDELSPLIEPPYLQSELVANVDHRCGQFEQSAPAAILSLIFPKDSDNAEANSN